MIGTRDGCRLGPRSYGSERHPAFRRTRHAPWLSPRAFAARRHRSSVRHGSGAVSPTRMRAISQSRPVWIRVCVAGLKAKDAAADFRPCSSPVTTRKEHIGNNLYFKRKLKIHAEEIALAHRGRAALVGCYQQIMRSSNFGPSKDFRAMMSPRSEGIIRMPRKNDRQPNAPVR